MAESTLKPNTGNDLVLSNDDGTAKIEVNEGADIDVTIGSSAGDDFNVGSGKLLVEGDSSLVSTTGDLKVVGNDIQDSGGSSAIKFDGSQNVEVVGDLQVTGNDIKASDGTTSLTLSGANVAVAGNLTGGNIEGTALKSTGESGATKFLREDGDGTCSWQTPSAVPSGMIAPIGMSSAPTGWLACDGSAISRTTYSALFGIIGTTWGTGDGSSTFNVPDLRGAWLRGIGTAGVSGDYVGPTNMGDYQDDQNASHNHGASTSVSVGSVGNHSHGMRWSSGAGGRNWPEDPYVGNNNSGAMHNTYDVGGHSHSASGSTSIGSQGGTEARVYNRGVQYCIKY